MNEQLRALISRNNPEDAELIYQLECYEENKRRVIPQYTKIEIDKYIETGYAPSSFLYSVLTNDLRMAYGAADDANIHNMYAIVSYIFNKAPADCWGHAMAVHEWGKKKQLEREEKLKRIELQKLEDERLAKEEAESLDALSFTPSDS